MSAILFILLLAQWESLPDGIERMLDLAHVTQADTVYDLGSGDGRIVIAAAKRGAKAIGIEINPARVSISRDNIKKAGVNAEIRNGDYYLTNFSDATVIAFYVGNAEACRLKPRLQVFPKGTRIVSPGDSICDWTPDKVSVPAGASLWVIK
jgi:ribosomal protein L11 methylase PrmA